MDIVRWVAPTSIMVMCITIVRFVPIADPRIALIIGWVGAAVSCLLWEAISESREEFNRR